MSAWITGAGTGIGESAALKLAEACCVVVVSGRRIEPLDSLVARITDAGGSASGRPFRARLRQTVWDHHRKAVAMLYAAFIRTKWDSEADLGPTEFGRYQEFNEATSAAGVRNGGLALQGDGARAAKAAGRTGVVFQFQGAAPIEDDLRQIAVFKQLGVGIDYYLGQQPVVTGEEAEIAYRREVDAGRWASTDYPPPPHMFPVGMETPKHLPNLKKALLEHGDSVEDTLKILG